MIGKKSIAMINNPGGQDVAPKNATVHRAEKVIFSLHRTYCCWDRLAGDAPSGNLGYQVS